MFSAGSFAAAAAGMRALVHPVPWPSAGKGSVNDTREDISSIAAFIKALPNLQYYELIPFHPLAANKYRSLNIPNLSAGIKTMKPEVLDNLADCARNEGVKDVRVG